MALRITRFKDRMPDSIANPLLLALGVGFGAVGDVGDVVDVVEGFNVLIKHYFLNFRCV